MSQASDLVSLSKVKAWASIASSVDDVILDTLITSISRAILTYLQRPVILPTIVTEFLNGSNNDRIVLRNWPVISVSSLTIGGSVIPASPALIEGASEQAGYVLEPADPWPPGRIQALYLRGYSWRNFLVPYGDTQRVIVAYKAGYQVPSEAHTIPASPPYTLTAISPYGAWAADSGVSYASGVALTPVSGSPAAGQYSVAAGVYTFAAADAGMALLIAYGYVPADLANACLEWVAERYSARSRTGIRSKSLGGQETMSYFGGSIPDFVAKSITPYRRVVPI